MSYIPWDEQQYRHEICAVGRRLYDLFFAVGNDGNISVRLSADRILITPSGVSKGLMRPEMLMIVSPEGEVLQALEGYKPSSENRMHLAIYRHRPDVRAVVHAHPPTATGLAVAGVGLDQPFLAEAVVRTGPTPLVPYVIPGGDELPNSLIPYLAEHSTLLLGNHGVVAYARTLQDAAVYLETVEFLARVYLAARQAGQVNTLSPEQVAALRERYG